MSINIPSSILDFKGQCVNAVNCNPGANLITIQCRRNKRYSAKDPINKKRVTVNRYVRRSIHDMPLLNYRVEIKIELAEVLTKNNQRLIETCDFVDKGCYYTKRFCRLISGLCRHMTVSAVAKHFALRWGTAAFSERFAGSGILKKIELEG